MLCLSSKTYAEIKELPRLTVFADESSVDFINDKTREFARKEKVIVNVVYGSSEKLSENIIGGAIADILIAENEDFIQVLKNKGLIDVYSITNLAKNYMVLVCSASDKECGNNLDVEIDRILKSASLLFVVKSHSEAVTSYLMRVSPEVINSVEEVFSTDELIREVNEYRSYGVISESSALKSHNLKLVARFPEESQSKITYQGAVVAGDNMDVARKFLEYLKKNVN